MQRAAPRHSACFVATRATSDVRRIQPGEVAASLLSSSSLRAVGAIEASTPARPNDRESLPAAALAEASDLHSAPVIAFERATRAGEWRHENDTGAYAASTGALVHTRGEHGLLVASSGGHHHVVLSRLELRVLPSHAGATGRRTLADLLQPNFLLALATCQNECFGFSLGCHTMFHLVSAR